MVLVDFYIFCPACIALVAAEAAFVSRDWWRGRESNRRALSVDALALSGQSAQCKVLHSFLFQTPRFTTVA